MTNQMRGEARGARLPGVTRPTTKDAYAAEPGQRHTWPWWSVGGRTYRPIKDGPRIQVRLVWWRDDRPAGLAHLVDAVTRLYAGP